MAVSLRRRDHLMRNLVTPAADSHDYLGRATTATVDHLGRDLVALEWPGIAAVTKGAYYQIVASGIVYKVTVAGNTAAPDPAAPGVGNTVVSDTATLEQITTG